MPGARYRLMITGIRCDRESFDDPFEGDGKGDEVFINWSVRVFDNSGQLKLPMERTSLTMGDTNGWVNRVQAGSRSSRGGIKTGDMFPPDNVRAIPPDVANRLDVPPLTVTDLVLRAEEDEVFFTPTIWEWDTGATMLDQLIDWHKNHDAQFGQKAKENFGRVWPVAAPFFDIVSAGIQTIATIRQGPPGTRPIGWTAPESGDRNVLEFKPKVIAINYNTAESLIASDPNSALGIGWYEVPYADTEALKGDYKIFVALQRLEYLPEDLPFPDGTVVRETSHAEVYVIYGRAKFWIPTEAVLFMYAPRGGADIQVIANGELARRTKPIPIDGTLLRERDKANVYLMRDGKKSWVKTSGTLNQFGGFGQVRVVPSGTLADISNGPDME